MLRRTLGKHLGRIVENFPVILITGPRQVGKSTLLENFKPTKYKVVNLDDFNQRELANTDPELFLQRNKPPVIIDEIQYAPNLFSYIKIYVDQHRGEKGLFLLTGSQKFALMKGVRESLAGRVAVLDLLGLSAAEKEQRKVDDSFLPTTQALEKMEKRNLGIKTISEIYTMIWNGSFPELSLRNGEDRDLYYNSYIQTYIERDVRDISNISDPLTFKNFIRVIAARTGQLLNLADVARDLAIDNKTAKNWLNILEMSGLIYLLHPYYNNITKRIIKTPKVYFLDTGLCSYLTGWDTPRSLENGAMSGAILETYVFAEILKSYWHNAKEAPIYFYRDKDMKEVDFLLEANGKLYPIEVKRTMTPTLEAAKNFAVLEKLKKPVETAVILSLKAEPCYLSRQVITLPVWAI